MARPRKRHTQQHFVFRTWGGRRKRAGRKQVNERKSQPHRKRPELAPNTAAHITLRMADDVARLRRRDAYQAIRRAMLVVLRRTDFRIVHMSIQANHVHLIVEADSKLALARGMQAFQISAARKLNQAEAKRSRKRQGPVFPDRYYPEILLVPLKARHALSYVLNNWRRHKEDRASYAKTWLLDPYSSAVKFDGWAEYSSWKLPDDYEPLPVCSPQSWLLREGWRRHGPISVYEEPGPR